MLTRWIQDDAACLRSLPKSSYLRFKIVTLKKISITIEGWTCRITIEPGLLRKLGPPLSRLLPRQESLVLVITNPAIRAMWGPILGKSLGDENINFRFLEMKDGERYKTLATVENLAEKLVKLGADRSSLIVALGGGVVGDVAGFLASSYMRGVGCVQVPTTFLAQVDSSVGGKTGVNLKSGKNLLGSFQQPQAVFIDPEVLQTMPDREFRAGLYEALKYGIIRDPKIFNYMEQYRRRLLDRHPSTLEHVIAASVRVKAQIVTLDEREAGLRRILNFGHTLGHALEAETGYQTLLHGEAVAWGMIGAVFIASMTGRLKAVHANHIISAVLAFAPLPPIKVSSQNVRKRLGADKKAVGGVPYFVLPLRIGQVEIATGIPPEIIERAVDELRRLSVEL